MVPFLVSNNQQHEWIYHHHNCPSLNYSSSCSCSTLSIYANCSCYYSVSGRQTAGPLPVPVSPCNYSCSLPRQAGMQKLFCSGWHQEAWLEALLLKYHHQSHNVLICLHYWTRPVLNHQLGENRPGWMEMCPLIRERGEFSLAEWKMKLLTVFLRLSSMATTYCV